MVLVFQGLTTRLTVGKDAGPVGFQIDCSRTVRTDCIAIV